MLKSLCVGLLMTVMGPGAMAATEKNPIRLVLEADSLPVRKMMVYASNKVRRFYCAQAGAFPQKILPW